MHLGDTMSTLEGYHDSVKGYHESCERYHGYIE